MGNRQNFEVKPNYNNQEFIKDSRYPLILVEGINDKAVYETVYDKNWLITMPKEPKEYNKDKSIKRDIIEIIKDYNTCNCYRNLRVGIVDRDYDPKENIINLFYTDKNDIESTAIQILSEDEAWEIFPNMLKINCAKYEFTNLYHNAQKVSNELSNFWKHIHDYNKVNNTNISYLINLYDKNEQSLLQEIISYNSINTTYEIDYKRLSSLYKSKEYNNYIQNMDKNTIQDIMKQSSNHFRGHDFFHIFIFLILKETNINSLELKGFEKKYMEKSTEKYWIKKTKLYKDVKDIGAFK